MLWIALIPAAGLVVMVLVVLAAVLRVPGFRPTCRHSDVQSCPRHAPALEPRRTVRVGPAERVGEVER